MLPVLFLVLLYNADACCMPATWSAEHSFNVFTATGLAGPEKALGWYAAGGIYADGVKHRLAVTDSGFAVSVQPKFNGNLAPYVGRVVFDLVAGEFALTSNLTGCYKGAIPPAFGKIVQMGNFNCFSPANKVKSIQLAGGAADVYTQSFFQAGHGGFNLTQTVDPTSCRIYANSGVVLNGNGIDSPVAFFQQNLWNIASGVPSGVFDIPSTNCTVLNTTAALALTRHYSVLAHMLA